MYTMQHGDILLLDEISLLEDAVLDLMNWIVYSDGEITVFEKGDECIEIITANPKFCILSIMNPGCDFDKKELIASLRNRLTSMCVCWLNGLYDVNQILDDV